MKTLRLACTLLLLSLAAATCPAADAQKIGNVDTSKWRGFNLLEKFTLAHNAPFVEDDFRWIAEWRFNFVRLPVDYRCYVEKGDWLKFKEPVLKEIDQAIDFGQRYKIHVCLNLHRAPGFCINSPAEATNLWTDDEPLRAFIAHWTMFARRYKDIPPERLSFNLLNEPTRTTRENYLKVFCRTIEAIQKEDPRRLILVDGMNVGHEPVPELMRYENVIQATRGYAPGQISHYRANWVQGSDRWPEPIWPMLKISGYLYAPSKADLHSPLVLRGTLPAKTQISLKLGRMTQPARLVAKADGQTILERTIDPQTSPDDWKRLDAEKRWAIYETARDVRLTIDLPAAAREFSLENAAGDWLLFRELSLQMPGGVRRTYPADMAWGQKQAVQQVTADGQIELPPGADPAAPLTEFLKPWRDIAARGETVFVGEWGCFNKTPHPVVLAWMKSWLEEWKQTRFGWALWNFRGTFGILDSGRTDVQYEDWHGHKLDRQMLDLLQQYLPE